MLDEYMKYKRALSNDEFYRSGINPYDYHFCRHECSFIATLDSKRWGKKRNILAYFTTEEGIKIIASAWVYGLSKVPYLGLDKIPIGTRVRITFLKGSFNTPYLRAVELV
ncbi:hypothetical protein [Ruminococcus sp.]|uniref:hypothetical protein n=1 Tax=Ruminococcus sp. TaxID=41978 RepID=UPI002E75F715|nr:hypothetical protein [Ruminococcus sp.]MEE1263339.1 hypothetical protein [Ruminococcus sp.]